MPTYEYKCSDCGHNFEIFQAMSDEPLKKCDNCGSDVRRVFGNAGIIFKGSGFYVNDYKKDGSGNAPVSNRPDACAGCSNRCGD
ncbi:MAG: zinc ribbon domain-containing protein [Leptospirales bacterium]|nr:zinc ribbon domain-containing protein [Leptospirales bacterium]